MLSRRQRIANTYARWFQKPMLGVVRPDWVARMLMKFNSIVVYSTPIGLHLKPLPDVPRATVCKIGSANTHGTLLYIHGGGFVIGGLRDYRHLVARLGKASGQRAVFVDYRLAPENPFPAAPLDVLAAYEALLADPESGPITIAGDSAGGNLCFALLLMIKGKDLPMPKAVAAFSPICDLRLVNPSLEANLKTDALVSMKWGARSVGHYLGDTDRSDPIASPIFGDFTGAPPVLIHVDTTETLHDDATLLAARLQSQAVPVTLVETTGRTHVWHLNVGRVPEANASVAEAGAFLHSHLG